MNLPLSPCHSYLALAIGLPQWRDQGTTLRTPAQGHKRSWPVKLDGGQTIDLHNQGPQASVGTITHNPNLGTHEGGHTTSKDKGGLVR